MSEVQSAIESISSGENLDTVVDALLERGAPDYGTEEWRQRRKRRLTREVVGATIGATTGIFAPSLIFKPKGSLKWRLAKGAIRAGIGGLIGRASARKHHRERESYRILRQQQIRHGGK